MALGCRDRSSVPPVGIPCSTSSGVWVDSLQCYVMLANPQPPLSDPSWGGRTTGAIYSCTTITVPLASTIWLAAGPAGLAPTPAQLAIQALATLRVPVPAMHRSPPETNSDAGQPYTWVNAWTWFWTDTASWRELSATARAGGVWARVTVTPSTLTYSPGDGGGAVSCVGPGRPWQVADANTSPSGGGCGYRYQHVSANGPITATLTSTWTVTWVGSGGSSGTLPDLTRQVSSSFVVEQIQVVNR